MKKLSRIFTWITVLLLTCGLLFSTPRSVQAANVSSNGMIEGTIEDDLIVIAKNIVINGKVNGSLIAIGVNVTVNGTVNGDALIFAGNGILTQNGYIQGNLITAAARLEIHGTVGRNLIGAAQNFILQPGSQIIRNVYFGGFALTVMEESEVKKDLTALASQIVVRGSILRNANLTANGIELLGRIEGDVTIDVSAPGDKNILMDFIPNMPTIIYTGLRVDPKAVVIGSFIYTSPVDQTDAVHGALTNPAVYQTPVPSETQRKAAEMSATAIKSTSATIAWVWNFLRKMVTFLVLGALILWLLPRYAGIIKDRLVSHAWPSFGIGFLVWIAGIFFVLILPILYFLAGLLINYLTLGGLAFTWFGLVGAAILLVMVVFIWIAFVGSGLISAYTLGDWILGKISPHANGRKFLAMLLGVMLFVLLSTAPYIGWLTSMIASIIGMGAIWIGYRNLRHRKKAAKK